MKSHLVALLCVVSFYGCRTADSSALQGTPDQDTKTSAWRRDFISGRGAAGTKELEDRLRLDKKWKCESHWAVKNQWSSDFDDKQYVFRGANGVYDNYGSGRVKTFRYTAADNTLSGIHESDAGDVYTEYLRFIPDAGDIFITEFTVSNAVVAKYGYKGWSSVSDSEKVAIAYTRCAPN